MLPDSKGKDANKSPGIGDTVTLLHVKPSKKAIYRGIVSWISDSGNWISIDGYHGIINVKYTKVIERKGKSYDFSD